MKSWGTCTGRKPMRVWKFVYKNEGTGGEEKGILRRRMMSFRDGFGQVLILSILTSWAYLHQSLRAAVVMVSFCCCCGKKYWEGSGFAKSFKSRDMT